jgi:hypothetical protein
MILTLHSNTSYLSEAKARSCKPSNNSERTNGAILNKSSIMWNVMSLAAEAECGALFKTTTKAIHLRNTLEEIWATNSHQHLYK